MMTNTKWNARNANDWCIIDVRNCHYIKFSYSLPKAIANSYLNCVEVPNYLLDVVPEVHIVETASPGHKKTITELTAALKQSAEENETRKVNNLSLTNKHNQLCTMQEEQANSSKMREEELTQLQLEIEEHENSMKIYVDNEAKLRVIIENQQNETRVQWEKFNEFGNPHYYDESRKFYATRNGQYW